MDFIETYDAIENVFDSHELYYHKERSKKFESKEREICCIEIKEEEGMALRAIKDHKMIFTYTYDRDNAPEALLKNATALLPVMERDDDRFLPGRQNDYPVLSFYDSESLKIDDAQKIAFLIDMESAIRDYDKKIVTVRNCELQEIELAIKIRNSNGLAAESAKTLYVLSALCVAKDKDEVSWYDWSWAHSFNELDGKKLAMEIAQKTISFLSGKQIDTGIYEGILTPQASCDILGVLSDAFLSENVYKNKTRLKTKEGTKCFSETLTIIDSGTMGIDSFPFDGEGIPSKENLVVNNGYFETFLYDSYYGRKFGVDSTGNSSRSGIKEPPKCGSRGTFIKQGERDVRNLLSNGIIIEELMGAHTANPITGDFSLGAVGYMCKNGDRTPFQGVIFSGNIFELFKNVKEAGNDLRFYGSFGSPSLFIEGLKISGK
jgi:PmbA protein